MAKAMTASQTIAQMKKWGVPYREYHGWETRGRGPMGDVHGIIIHHTGSDAQSDSYLRFLAVDGRGDLPAPLCNVSTDMDGDLWLIATARANHAGGGSSITMQHVINEDYAGSAYKAELKPGPDNLGGTYCNGSYYGNEVRYDGGQPMTAKQFDSAVRWAAAVCDFHGWSAQSVIGHREHTRRKPDPGHCPMYQFRLAVSRLLAAGPHPQDTPKPPTPAKDMIDMATEAEVAKAVETGIREYLGDFYNPAVGGTGAAMRAEAKANAQAIVDATKAASDAQVAAIDRLTAAVEALAPKA